MLSRIADWIDENRGRRAALAFASVAILCLGIGFLYGWYTSGSIGFAIWAVLFLPYAMLMLVQHVSVRRESLRCIAEMEKFDLAFEARLAEFRREMGVSEARLQ